MPDSPLPKTLGPLFLDLDGVLADFDRGVHAVTGARPEELPLKTMWAALADAPTSFETWS